MVRAVVVGSLVMDLAFRVPSRPQPGEVVIATSFGTFRGGKGYNQAVALARLGAEVSFVGAVGADAYGDAFLAALGREGVDAGRVVQLRGVSTAVAAPLITPDGDVGFVQYPGANRQLAPAVAAELPDCDLLLLQGEVPAATSTSAARVIARRGGIVVLNPAPVHDVTPELLELATVLCPNEVEARALVPRLVGAEGAPEGPAQVTAEMAAELDGRGLAAALAREGRAAVVTLGAAGAAWRADGDEGSVAPPDVAAVDATGAGDAFCAALGIGLAEGAPYADAVAFGCAAGALAATREGAEPSLPRRAEVTRLLESTAA